MSHPSAPEASSHQSSTLPPPLSIPTSTSATWSSCIARQPSSRRLLRVAASLVTVGLALGLIFSAQVPSSATNVVYTGAALSNQRTAASAGSSSPSSCRAHDLGYTRMSCPVWTPGVPVGEQKSVDWRVRYLHRHQHPSSCSDANYIVQPWPDQVGFGAMIRGFVAGSLWAAMQSDRVLLAHPDELKYGGCESHSWSCYFEPLTTCSYATDVQPLIAPPHPPATSHESPVASERGGWRNSSVRVHISGGWMPLGVVDKLPLSDAPMQNRAEWEAGIYLYLLRLNKQTLSRVEAALREALPCDLMPQRTIALPIRASDKCQGAYHIAAPGFTGETECLSFDTYMEMAELIRAHDPDVDTVILTSEDARFVEARHNYTDRWRFVVNPLDVMQGTGTPSVVDRNHSMDSVFLSFYTSLQMQMRARYFVLNCASNFHKVLQRLVQEGGCSFVRPTVICMDEQVQRFKICTVWEKFEECVQNKKSAMEKAVMRQLRGRR